MNIAGWLSKVPGRIYRIITPELYQQRRRSSDRWAEVAQLERNGANPDDIELQFAVTAAFEAQDWLAVLETNRLRARAKDLDVDFPKAEVGTYFRQYFHADPEDMGELPLFLTDNGLRLVRRLIAAAQKQRRERYAFYAAIVFGLLGSIGSVITALSALYQSSPSRVEVVVMEVPPSTPLPPAIWGNTSAFDPIEHFFLFPTTGTPKLKWTGEVRPLR